jgi:superfamily II DNA or RNA helicase
MVQPTDEQEKAVEKFRTRRPLKIAAFAGTGKTSTLSFMARSRRSSGLYLAFNKAIATEAKEKFPRTVDCRTTYSLAYRSVVLVARETECDDLQL